MNTPDDPNDLLLQITPLLTTPRLKEPVVVEKVGIRLKIYATPNKQQCEELATFFSTLAQELED